MVVGIVLLHPVLLIQVSHCAASWSEPGLKGLMDCGMITSPRAKGFDDFL